MSDCVEIQFDEVSFPLKSPFPKRVTTPSRLVDKRAEAAVARNVTPRKTLARERAQNKINECYSRLFCSFLSVIFIHIIRNITKLKCLCGKHLRDNCVVVVTGGLQSADVKVKELSIVKNGNFFAAQSE